MTQARFYKVKECRIADFQKIDPAVEATTAPMHSISSSRQAWTT